MFQKMFSRDVSKQLVGKIERWYVARKIPPLPSGESEMSESEEPRHLCRDPNMVSQALAEAGGIPRASIFCGLAVPHAW